MKYEFFNESYGFLLGITYRRASQLFTNRLKDYEITPEQWLILRRLSCEHGISQKEVALRCEKDQPTTARILESLISKGMIEKKNSESDRRVSLVYITEKGKRIFKETIPIEKKIWEEITEDFTEEQHQLFKETLFEMNNKIMMITERSK